MLLRARGVLACSIVWHMGLLIRCLCIASSAHKVSTFGLASFAPLFITYPFSIVKVALTQITTRINISRYGEQMASPHKRLRIKTVLLLSCAYYVLDFLLICTMIWTPNVAARVFSVIVFCLFNFPVAFAFCHVVSKSRKQVRVGYNIPETSCEGCEDTLVSVLCTPCTIAQMMRQTADYDTYRAIWFSESGLPNHATAKPFAAIDSLSVVKGESFGFL